MKLFSLPFIRLSAYFVSAMVLTAISAFAQERVAGLAVDPIVWRSVGPGGGGWIESMCASRHDPQRFFVGCDVGGFYFSKDGGRHYEIRNRGLRNMFIETLAEHPSDENILFAGSRGGIYKSTDCGRTWTEKRIGLPPASSHSHTVQISKFAFDAADPRVMYAAAGLPRGTKGGRGEVWKSSDGGETWTMPVVPGAFHKKAVINDLAAHPRISGRLLAATDHGLYSTTDGGIHWQPSNAGLPLQLRTRRLAQSPSHPKILYVTLRQKGGEKPWSAGVYRSDDGGATWAPRQGGLPSASGLAGADDCLCHWYDAIAVHPSNPDIVYVGSPTWWGAGVFKTTDGGRNWKRVFGSKERTGWISFWGPSAMCLTLSPCAPDTVVFGTSGMVFRTEDGGDTWSQRYTEDRSDGRIASSGLEVTCLHSVQGDPKRKGRFFLNYFDIGLLVTEDNGRTMRRLVKGIPGKYNNSCYAVALDPEDTNHWWGAFGTWGGNHGCIAETHDAGENWTALTNEACGFTDATPSHLVRLGDQPPYTLVYLANRKGVRVSRDGGVTWAGVPETALPGGSRATALTADKGTLYVGLSAADKDNGSLWKSADGGITWSLLINDAACLGEVKDIAADGARLLVAARERWSRPRGMRQGGGWFSTDGGVTWRRVFSDKFCGAALFAGTDLLLSLDDNPYHDYSVGGGVIRSRDGGTTWTTLNSPSLMNWNVTELCADPFDPCVLWLGTGGNSVFTGRLD